MAVREKIIKIMVAVLIMVLSAFVLVQKVPENKYIVNTVDRLEENRNTVMEFSGAMLATSVAISALPDDFATPLADSLADMNLYFILIFAVLAVEKIIMVEGVKIVFLWIIPATCLLYIASVLFQKAAFCDIAKKLAILSLAVLLVIPISTFATEHVCEDYLVYVNETIEEAEDGANKVTDIMAVQNEESTIFDKLSEAFKTSIQGVNDLLIYFKNVIRKSVNSIAIMIVTTCLVPLGTFWIFKWLLGELFKVSLSIPVVKLKMPKHGKSHDTNELELGCEEE